jgi:diguanylate cyclase (GGDEF)-like protein
MALILLTPLGQPAVTLQHLRGPIRLDLVANLAAWLVCLGYLITVVRARKSPVNNPPFAFISDSLALFLLFFAMEHLIGHAALWPPLHWLSHRLPWVQMLASITVAMCAAPFLPRPSSMAESADIARKEHDRFLAAAESSLDDFYIFDGVANASGRITDFRFNYMNPNAERRLNTRRESLVGKILTEVRPFMISSGLIERYREVVRTGKPFTCEVFIDDEMIKGTWINVQVVKLGDGIAITSRDVTERKRLDDHVNYLAHHDQLTGLANRTLLHDRLRQAVLRAQRRKEKIAVFMLDIDHFKRINDTLGHADGDTLLTAIGKRLLSSVRETDTVARMGGDEFVIVMTDFKCLEDVKRCGLQIIEKTARPITIGDHEINITVSVGLCIYPDYGLEADQLLKNADAAMYRIKDSGRNGLQIFTGSMLEESRNKPDLKDNQPRKRCSVCQAV